MLMVRLLSIYLRVLESVIFTSSAKFDALKY